MTSYGRRRPRDVDEECDRSAIPSKRASGRPRHAVPADTGGDRGKRICPRGNRQPEGNYGDIWISPRNDLVGCQNDEVDNNLHQNETIEIAIPEHDETVKVDEGQVP